MCEHIDKRFCIFKGLDSNRKSFAAIFIFGFCQLSQLSHFEQLNCSTISFYSHYDWILFFRIYFPTVGTPHWSECPVHAHSFWVLIIYVCIFFSVLILPNKAWHKDIKLVTNTIYSCVNHTHRSDEGLTLETSAFLFFTVANLRFQPSC